MRVCHLITSLALGGAETQLLRYVSNDDAVDHVVYYLGFDDALESEFEAAGVPVYGLGATSKADSSLAALRLVRRLRRDDPDVLHNHQVHSMVFGRLAAKVAGIDTVVSTHQNVRDAYGSLFERLEELTRSLDTVTVAVSHGVKASFASDGTPFGQWEVVYNSIRLDEFRSTLDTASEEATDVRRRHDVENDDVLFLNVGRYVDQKNQRRLVEAVHELGSDQTGVHVVIVGWGSLREELDVLVSDYSVEDSISVTGRVRNIHPYYAAADAFVLSSHFEGLSVASVEALAAGLPILGTDVPGVREVVEPDQNGLLVEPDSAPALADGMRALFDDERRRQYGTRSRAIADERFGIETTIERYHELYLRCLEET